MLAAVREETRTEDTINYGDPGAGAVEFAKQFIVGLTDRSEMLDVFSRLKDGELHDKDDKRVKRCDYCRYYFRDESLRNNKRTCCDECKTGIKTLQKRVQRERKELLNPTPKPKKRKLADDYVYWLEYPYWTDEYSMLKLGWKYEVPHKIETMDFVEAHRELWGDGNRRNTYVNYDESDAEERYNDFGQDEF